METASKHMGLASEGKEEQGLGQGKVLGAVYSHWSRSGARLRAWVGKNRPSKLDVPAGLTRQGEMGVVSCS